MGDKSKIEWTDATWNPVTGCTRVSEGCRNCYMARTVPRQGLDPWKVVLHPDRLEQPLKWRRPRRIFVNSLSDLFHEAVPDEFIDQVMRMMANSRHHTYQVLTKRPERMRDYLAKWWNRCYQDWETGKFIPVNPPKHIWFGVSIENQETADERIPLLLRTPAAKRFISAEPLLGPVELSGFVPSCACYENGEPHWDKPTWQGPFTKTICDGPQLDWVIAGGESGPGARPCDLAWIRAIRDQCKAAGVSCFVKQIGSNPIPFKGAKIKFYKPDVVAVELADRKGGDWSEWPEDLRVREFPTKGARDE